MKRKQAYLGKLRPYMLKISILPVALLCLSISFSVYAQLPDANSTTSAQYSSGLEIGDEIPKEVWDLPLKVVNHPDDRESITLNDYKSKLIILDFWGTRCGPCIASLDKLNALSQTFKSQLQVLPVTRQEWEEVAPFIIKKKWLLPSIVGDTLLSQIFPHQTIPHQVWIKNKRVMAITGPEYATKDIITQALEGKQVHMRMKKELLKFDRRSPLLVKGNGGSDLIPLYQSAITGRVATRGSGLSWSDSTFLMYNSSLISLYKEAFRDQRSRFKWKNRLILEVSDSMKNALLDNADQHTYCYSLLFHPPMSRKAIRTAMREDLNRFFGAYLGIAGKIEKRLIPCLVLRRTGDSVRLGTTGGNPQEKYNAEKQTFLLKNKPFSQLITALNRSLQLPVINTIGYFGNIDISLHGDLKDMEGMIGALRRYGLTLTQEKRMISTLVISEKEKPENNHINQ